MRSLDLSKEKKHDIANILPEKVEESELNQDQRESKEVLELPNLNSEYSLMTIPHWLKSFKFQGLFRRKWFQVGKAQGILKLILASNYRAVHGWDFQGTSRPFHVQNCDEIQKSEQKCNTWSLAHSYSIRSEQDCKLTPQVWFLSYKILRRSFKVHGSYHTFEDIYFS